LLILILHRWLDPSAAHPEVQRGCRAGRLAMLLLRLSHLPSTEEEALVWRGAELLGGR
jgi:hypothetical protein